jgi:hypothetical protein
LLSSCSKTTLTENKSILSKENLKTISTTKEEIIDSLYTKVLINENIGTNYPNIYLKHYYVHYVNGDEEEVTDVDYCQYIKGDTILVTNTFIKK